VNMRTNHLHRLPLKRGDAASVPTSQPHSYDSQREEKRRKNRGEQDSFILKNQYANVSVRAVDYRISHLKLRLRRRSLLPPSSCQGCQAVINFCVSNRFLPKQHFLKSSFSQAVSLAVIKAVSWAVRAVRPARLVIDLG